MNKRGIALILSFIIIVVLIILGAAVISQTISESNIIKRFIGSTKALWAAEAGVAKAAAQLPATPPLNGTLGEDSNLTYATTTTLVAGFSNRWTINSTGSYVLSGGSGETISRTLVVVVEKSLGPDPNLIANAIETTGDLKITGSVDINPDDSQLTNSTLSFQGVFGMSKDEVKAMADHTYTNPPTNQQPVDGITWVDLPVDPITGKTDKYVISSDWSGSGLLIVNGNGVDVALDIAGGWTFNGVIWVIGKLSISGTPTITGALFAESSIDVTQTLSGNATLNFNGEVKDSAFNLITQDIEVNILSWQEVY